MIYSSLVLPLLITLFSFSIGLAGNSQMLIEQISHDLKQTSNSQTKSTLHIYRARQYTKMMKWEMALEDYNDAMELNHKGWIHLERSHLLMLMGEHELAYEDANAAKEEAPTLSSEADKVIEKSAAEVRKKYEAENPITIIMDTEVDPYRKTRFDVMREQGVFAAKARKIHAYSSNKQTASIKKTSTSSTTKSRS